MSACHARIAVVLVLGGLVAAGAGAAPKGPAAPGRQGTNAVVELLSTVKTTRGFSDRPVAADLVSSILACGANAPSALNRQPWFFSVVLNGEVRNELGRAAEALMAKRMAGQPAGSPGTGNPGAAAGQKPVAGPQPGASGGPGQPGQAGQPPAAPAGAPRKRNSLDNAPVVIIVSGTRDWPWSTFDCALATEAMASAAQSLGLGAHIVAGPVDALKGAGAESLRKHCGVPSDKEPVAILLVGYPADGPDAVSRASDRRSGLSAIVW